MTEITYLVPQVGPTKIPLYPPADEVYRLLEEAGEISRLSRLIHIGALEVVFPGVSHTRWDYTVSMLYVVTRLRRLTANSRFRLGAANFTSMAAALQCLALLSNTGHLPGTYSVEKAASRFLLEKNKVSPLDGAFELALGNDLGEFRTTLAAANDLLGSKDYLALNRLLSILKLASNFAGRIAFPRWLVLDLLVPFVLRDLRSDDARWSELDEYFDAARRLAYLNRDTALVDSPVTVGLSPLLSNLVDPDGLTKEALRQSQRITAAYEHAVYDRFYHAPMARRATAVVAAHVLARLRADVNAEVTVLEWLYAHNMDAVIDRRAVEQMLSDANLVCTISLRTFFPSLNDSESVVERSVEKLLATGDEGQIRAASAVSRYVPSESRHSVTADQVHLDVVVFGQAKSRHAGLSLRWAADNLDNQYQDMSDVVSLWVRAEMDGIYESIIRRMIKLSWPGIFLELRAWPLSRLGKFREREDDRREISIWHASADLGDKFSKHIVRDTSAAPPALASIRDELRGLSQLRAQLRRAWADSRPRKRHFLITASIRLTRDAVQREFDGGILQLSSRSGAAILYLLETKGAQTPAAAANRLTEKLEALGLRGEIARLKSRSAYVALTL